MAATIQIHELTTNADTGVDKTSSTVRFKAVASTTSTTVDANDPLVVPGAGTNYSYVKSCAPTCRQRRIPISVTCVGILTGLADLGRGRMYGKELRDHVRHALQYGNERRLQSIRLYVWFTAQWRRHGYRTFVPADNTTYIGDIIELQISVASTATNGALSAETLTLAWDEV